MIWANATDVFLSSTPVGIGFTLIPDRAVNVFGFETKTVILSAREGNAVRNRVHASRKFPSESLRQELEGASKNVYIFEVNIYVYLYIIVGTRRRKAAGRRYPGGGDSGSDVRRLPDVLHGVQQY